MREDREYFGDLPFEVVQIILSNLRLETVFFWISVNKTIKLIYGPIFLEMFKQKYPFAVLPKQGPIDWPAIFQLIEKVSYFGLSEESKKLFFLIRHGNIEDLELMEIDLLDLQAGDKDGLRMVDHALLTKSQPLFNYLFERVLKIIESQRHILLNPYNLDITKFHWAVLFNQLDAVHELSKKDSNLLTQGFYGELPLHLAIKKGHPCIVDYLAAQCPVIVEATNGNTALHVAVEYGQTECVKILIKNKVNLCTNNFKGHSAIQIACRKGRMPIIEALLTENIHLLRTQDSYKQSLLLWAAFEGQTEIVRFLFQQGLSLQDPSVSQEKKRGNGGNNTPLHWACKNGHLNTVKLLIELGANLEMKNDDGEMAIELANQEGYFEIAKRLEQFSSLNPETHQMRFLFSTKKYECIGKSSLLAYLDKIKLGINYHPISNPRLGGFFEEKNDREFCLQVKLDAAVALHSVIFEQADPACLATHEVILKDPELKAIFDNLKLQHPFLQGAIAISGMRPDF